MIQNETAYTDARSQAGIYLNVTSNEAFLPSSLATQRDWSEIDAMRTSGLASITYLTATAAGADADTRKNATLTVSALSDIGASFILPKVIGQTTATPELTVFQSGSSTMISGVRIVDRKTGGVFEGTVDIQPTLERIGNGGPPISRNDGSVFRNSDQLLPKQPYGYYAEYVVPTPGISEPGTQRIVVGKGGEIYYTPNHYQTFIPVKK